MHIENAGHTRAKRRREGRRILFIVPSLARAGAERQVVDLVNGLSHSNFDIHLFNFGIDQSLAGRIDETKVSVHKHLKRARLDFAVVKSIAETIDRYAIDIVHCTLQNALLYGVLGVWLARREEVLLVAAIHTTVNVDMKNELADRLVYQFLLRQCNEVWFVCHTQADYWMNRYRFLKSKSHVLYNGIDSTFFAPQACRCERLETTQTYGIPDGSTVITCIAGFRPEKGHDILVRAMVPVLASAPGTYLLLVGDGPERRKTEQLAQRIGVQENVRFAGLVEDVRPILAISRCTVLASTAVETFSIAMLESMAMGTPVVSTDIGGAAEAIEDRVSGLLVAPGDVQALASALEAMATSEQMARRLGDKARQQVQSRFDTRNMVTAALQRLEVI